MRTFLNHQFKRVLPFAVLLLSTVAAPFLGYSQPGLPGGNAGIPDTPLGVPFDGRLNVLLLLAGVVFAVVIIKKRRTVNAIKH